MSLYGIPTLQRKSKPKKVMSEFARGGKVGLKCKINSNGNIFCNKRNPDQRPNTSYVETLKGKTKKQMIDKLVNKNIKNREELENMTAGEIRKLYEKPMDTPALRDAYKREAQKKKKAEAQKGLEKTGKVALYARKKRAEKFHKKAQENKKSEASPKAAKPKGGERTYKTYHYDITLKVGQLYKYERNTDMGGFTDLSGYNRTDFRIVKLNPASFTAMVWKNHARSRNTEADAKKETIRLKKDKYVDDDDGGSGKTYHFFETSSGQYYNFLDKFSKQNNSKSKPSWREELKADRRK